MEKQRAQSFLVLTTLSAAWLKFYHQKKKSEETVEPQDSLNTPKILISSCSRLTRGCEQMLIILCFELLPETLDIREESKGEKVPEKCLGLMWAGCILRLWVLCHQLSPPTPFLSLVGPKFPRLSSGHSRKQGRHDLCPEVADIPVGEPGNPEVISKHMSQRATGPGGERMGPHDAENGGRWMAERQLNSETSPRRPFFKAETWRLRGSHGGSEGRVL